MTDVEGRAGDYGRITMLEGGSSLRNSVVQHHPPLWKQAGSKAILTACSSDRSDAASRRYAAPINNCLARRAGYYRSSAWLDCHTSRPARFVGGARVEPKVRAKPSTWWCSYSSGLPEDSVVSLPERDEGRPRFAAASSEDCDASSSRSSRSRRKRARRRSRMTNSKHSMRLRVASRRCCRRRA
jgi:hypothetical protein